MQMGWGKRHSRNNYRVERRSDCLNWCETQTACSPTAAESRCSVASSVHGGTSASCDWHRQCCHDALCRKRLFVPTGLFCKCLVKVEPCQCRDLVSANQANPYRLPKQASAFGFRANLNSQLHYVYVCALFGGGLPDLILTCITHAEGD